MTELPPPLPPRGCMGGGTDAAAGILWSDTLGDAGGAGKEKVCIHGTISSPCIFTFNLF